MMLRLLIFVMALPSAAVAAELKLEGDAIKALLTDRSLYAGAAGETEQIFQSSGATFYLDQGNSSQGAWYVEAGKYCSTWPPNPTASCFDVYQDGDAVIFVSKSGKRFPMRQTR